MSPESFDKSKSLTPSTAKSVVWLGLVVISIILFICLYKTVAFEISCTRNMENRVECRIVPHSILRTLASIKVKDPLGVDVTQRKPLLLSSPAMGNSTSRNPYKAKMRMEDDHNSLILISSYRYETIQEIADVINQFLQDPSISSFQAYLPEGQKNVSGR